MTEDQPRPVYVVTPDPPVPRTMLYVLVSVLPTVGLFALLLITYRLLCYRRQHASEVASCDENVEQLFPMQRLPYCEDEEDDCEPVHPTRLSSFSTFGTVRQRTPTPPLGREGTPQPGTSSTLPFPYSAYQLREAIQEEQEATIYASVGRSPPSALPEEEEVDETITLPRRSERIRQIQARKAQEEAALASYAAQGGKGSKGRGKGGKRKGY